MLFLKTIKGEQSVFLGGWFMQSKALDLVSVKLQHLSLKEMTCMAVIDYFPNCLLLVIFSIN